MNPFKILKAVARKGYRTLPVLIPRGEPKKVILCWHTINDNTPRHGFVSNRRSQSSEIFKKQLIWLSGFSDFVDLETILDPTVVPKNRWLVSITFDDGYRDNFVTVLPILEAFQAPMCLFVATKFIQQKRLPWWDLIDWLIQRGESLSVDFGGGSEYFNLPSDESRLRALARRYFRDCDQKELDARLSSFSLKINENLENDFLNWEELHKMSEHPLIEIGAHTHSHFNTAACSLDFLLEDIAVNRNLLEKKLDLKIRYFAYPYGAKAQIGPEVPDALQSIGIEAGFSTMANYVFQSNNCIFLTPRIIIPPSDSMLEFKAQVKRPLLRRQMESNRRS